LLIVISYNASKIFALLVVIIGIIDVTHII
jgi:hypothetical protein